MTLRIVINDKEYTNPVVKYGLAAAFFVGAIAVSALIIFVLLPAIGISLVLSMGLIIVILVSIFTATVALVFGSALMSAVLVFVDLLTTKFKR